MNVLELVPSAWFIVFGFELSHVLISACMVLSFGYWSSSQLDYLLEWILIDIICIFVDSSKNPRIDSRARSKDLVGNLVIKTIENLITLLLLGSYKDWNFKILYGCGYVIENTRVDEYCIMLYANMAGTPLVGVNC